MQVIITKPARKDLVKLDKQTQQRIIAGLRKLEP